MPWKNIGKTTMQLPSGMSVPPDTTFTDKQGEGLNLRALERGFVIRKVGARRKKK